MSGSCNYTGAAYDQNYLTGLTVERENATSGAFLLPVPGNDGVLTGGESWSNASGTLKVAGNGSTVSVVRNTNVAPVSGGVASIGAPTARRDVSASASGFSPAPAGYRYQWTIDGQPVPGAEESTFRPTAAMTGRALAVIVTAYAPGLNPTSRTSSPQTVAPADWYATGARRSPEISGSKRVGRTLTAAGLDWVDYYGQKPGDLAVVYTWTRNGKVVERATSATYRLTAKDLGKRIQVVERPRAAGFDTAPYARSAPTSKVRIGRLVTTRPRIGGKVRVGKRVVARTKGWTRGSKLRYQWFVGRSAIRGATGKKLRLTRSLKGRKIAVKVTGTKKGFKKATAKSRQTKVK